MIIIGAGMAGLIAGNYFKGSTVMEQQTELPNNHQAVLRFKSKIISDITGIPFTKVMTRKNIVHESMFLDKPNIYAANQYSFKVTGELHDRSIWDLGDGYRYLAPPDFTAQLAKNCDIRYGWSLKSSNIASKGEPFISTIPMPILMKIVNWPHIPEFEYRPVWTLRCTIDEPLSKVEQTIYFPDKSVPFYRATLSSGTLIVELVESPGGGAMSELIESVLDCFGILDCSTWTVPSAHAQRFGKILPIDEAMRQDFIYTMSRERNIYSLGRFATWRPILLDDLANDLKVIENLVSHEGARRNYSQNLAIAERNK